MRDLNLAHRPFANLKPIRRVGLLLMLGAVGLTAVNAMLYWEHFTGEGQTRSRSQELTREIDEARNAVEYLQRQISSLDVGGLNRRTRFVNLEIDRRRFSWSRLFDRVAEVQPGEVRLLSMTPDFGDERGTGSRFRPPADEVELTLRGVAKNGEAILAFLDGLFEHPAFHHPDLSRESRREDGTSSFDLSVMYLPNVAQPSTEAGVEDAEESDSGGAADEEDTA